MNNEQNSLKIVLVGAGNVGWHLGKALVQAGQNIVQIYSRERSKAIRLAEAIDTRYTTDLQQITPDGDLYILAVKDEAIEDVARKIRRRLNIHFDQKVEPLVVHTSGATPSDVLQPYFKKYGVFYPLQTFSMHQAVDFEQIPICIHALNIGDVGTLFSLADMLTPDVFNIDDRQRKILHVTAVMVNNFTNHLYTLADEILEEEKIDFDILKPLIRETANKVQTHSPKTVQTGPAQRNDVTSIQQHLAYLEKYPETKKIYELFTENIKSRAK